MKLAVAADRMLSNPSSFLLRGILGSFMILLVAGAPAIALDDIELDEPAEAAAEGECPRLIQIKYPFLRCTNGQIGVASEDATWENSRRTPRQSEFVEGRGAWGHVYERD